MQIAICDDERLSLTHLEKIIRTDMELRGTSYDLASFSDGSAFLKEAAERKFDIVFLDIYMGAVNGIKTARLLNTLQKAKIIFTTLSTEFALEAFSLNAVHYLIKPVSPTALHEALNRCLLPENSSAVLSLKTSDKTICIREEDIIYIEADRKCTNIFVTTQTDPYTCHLGFHQVLNLLQSVSFLHCHRSYAVNPAFIDNIINGDVRMTNGHLVPVSRNKKSDITKQYEGYLLQQAKEGN